MLGVTLKCAAVSPHLYILTYTQVKFYALLPQLHTAFGDFKNGVCHVMKTTTAEITLVRDS